LFSKSEKLKVIGLGIPLATATFILWQLANSVSSMQNPDLTAFLTIATSGMAMAIPTIALAILKGQRTGKEIRRWLIEAADSIGAKQLIPFKITTVKRED
jgi:hypothetical protein